MTHIEEGVYDVLWGPKRSGEPEQHRIVKMGYAELAQRSRVSKRGIQSIIGRLIEKHVLQIEVPADTLRRIPTTYRVFSYGAIRKYQRDTGREWVIRTGNGVFYAKKLAANPASAPASTVEAGLPSTVEAGSSSTVEAGAPSTVAPSATSFIGIHSGMQATSSSVSPVASTLEEHCVSADDDGIRALIEKCRIAAPDATEAEIAHFVQIKWDQAIRMETVRNPLGFLMTAVPKTMTPRSLSAYREECRREGERERREAIDRAERYAAIAAEQQRILADPNSTEEMRQTAREYFAE
jgi:hypothetical protein